MMVVDGRRFDARRFVRAVLVGLACFLLVGGGVGFALAASEQAADKGSLALPTPHPGDRVDYIVHRSIIDPSVALGGIDDVQLDVVEYEWQPQQWVSDADFGLRLAHPLKATWVFMADSDDPVVYERTVFYDAIDGHPLAETEHSSMTEEQGYGLGVLDDPLASSSTLNYTDGTFQDIKPPCGMATPLHGTVTRQDAVLPIVGRCEWGQDTSTPTSFHADGWEDLPQTWLDAPSGWPLSGDWTGDWQDSSDWQDWSRYGKEGKDDPTPQPTQGRAFALRATDEPLVTLWYDQQSPFPVRMQVSMDEIVDAPWALGRIFTLDRQDVVAGTGTYSLVDPASLPEPKGPAPQAVRTPWMVDDTGIDLPFPLSRAYAAALAQVVRDPTVKDPESQQPTASAWLASHPDGYLAFAWAVPTQDRYGEEVPAWALIWVDGGSWLAKVVTYGAPEGMPLPTQAGSFVTISDWTPDLDENGHLAGTYPPRARLPDSFPSIAAVADRYHALFGSAAVLNGYGFEVACADELCSALDITVAAGQRLDTRQEVDVYGTGQAFHQGALVINSLQVDGEGRAALTVRYAQATESPLDLGAAPPTSMAEPVHPETSGFWVMPASKGAATGLGFVGLLASALYYFWPNLKGLAFTRLFSRIEDDEVLENPNRARILEVVRAEPGIHFQDLARKAAVGRGTLEHHLRKLEAAELVIIKRSKGYACCFPKGVVDRRLMEAAPVLRSQGGRQVLEEVAKRPGVSSRDLAVHLGLAPSTVSYHLKRLESAGLVSPDPGAGARLTPLGEQAKAAAA